MLQLLVYAILLVTPTIALPRSSPTHTYNATQACLDAPTTTTLKAFGNGGISGLPPPLTIATKGCTPGQSIPTSRSKQEQPDPSGYDSGSSQSAGTDSENPLVARGVDRTAQKADLAALSRLLPLAQSLKEKEERGKNHA
ncbi:hypothetical protein CAC42_998 [Sphaceloma murrayae]|uniref:Uncharacterized protein n=1 Tax=Sphaceloma murrayae TaxID=2082308 RepID=A0A2K1R300_9PEZI|nr:hypothetical protein CAC42_998 [Sphaceloma murrayae]